VAKFLAESVNGALEAWETQEGVLRSLPHELYLEVDDQALLVPFMCLDDVEGMIRGDTCQEVREHTLEVARERLGGIRPEATKDDVYRLVFPRGLVRGRTEEPAVPTRPVQEAPSGEAAAQLRTWAAARSERVVVSEDLVLPQSVVERLVEQFREEAQVGPRVAQKLIRDLAVLRERFCPRLSELSPGEMMVIASDARGHRIQGRKSGRQQIVPVIVQLFTEEELGWLAGVQSPSSKTIAVFEQRRMARVLVQAYKQGGLLPLAQMQWLFQLHMTKVGTALSAYEAEHQVILPTPGSVLDAGCKQTHKALITELRLDGRTTLEISRLVYHSPEAVDRYEREFDSVLILETHGVEPALMSIVLRRSPRLIRQLRDLVQEHFKTRAEMLDYLRRRAVPVRA